MDLAMRCIMAIRFLSTTQPTLNPSLSVITGSTVFITTHHRFHCLHHHPSPVPPYSAPPITGSLHRCHPSLAPFYRCHHQFSSSLGATVNLVPSSILFSWVSRGWVVVGLAFKWVEGGSGDQDCTVFGWWILGLSCLIWWLDGRRGWGCFSWVLIFLFSGRFQLFLFFFFG